MGKEEFAGYALGIVPGALTEEQTKKCKKAILNAQKQRDAKIKKAKAKRKNKQKGKRR